MTFTNARRTSRPVADRSKESPLNPVSPTSKSQASSVRSPETSGRRLPARDEKNNMLTRNDPDYEGYPIQSIKTKHKKNSLNNLESQYSNESLSTDDNPRRDRVSGIYVSKNYVPGNATLSNGLIEPDLLEVEANKSVLQELIQNPCDRTYFFRSEPKVESNNDSSLNAQDLNFHIIDKHMRQNRMSHQSLREYEVERHGLSARQRALKSISTRTDKCALLARNELKNLARENFVRSDSSNEYDGELDVTEKSKTNEASNCREVPVSVKNISYTTKTKGHENDRTPSAKSSPEIKSTSFDSPGPHLPEEIEDMHIERMGETNTSFDSINKVQELLIIDQTQNRTRKPRKSRLSVDATEPSSLPLSVQRDKERQMDLHTKSVSELKEQDTRRNLDKRSARLLHAKHFKAEIQNFLKSRGADNLQLKGEVIKNIYESRTVTDAGGLAIFVRKRPIFPYELARNDFDVVSVFSHEQKSHNSLGFSGSVTIHNCYMHADMRRMMIQPTSCPCTLGFDETCSNEVVYQTVAEPLVRDVAFNGYVSTILMFGQTGSGKTYTMSSIELHAAHNLFATLDELKGSACNISGFSYTVNLQFIELAGKVCRDLISKNPQENPVVKISDDKNGFARIVNATNQCVSSAEELTSLINLGKSRRATQATDTNGVSSRSHSVCQIEVIVKESGKRQRRGLLNLLDCAGTERRHDSLYHTSVRQKESAEINASLYALKECIRARTRNEATSPYVPYRSSNLTRILRESFERDDAKLCVIATVSPNSTDTEHSIETLKTIAAIAGLSEALEEDEARFVEPVFQKKTRAIIVPKQMTHDQLIHWLKKNKFPTSGISSSLDGKALFKLSALKLGQQCFGGNTDIATEVFKTIRNENDQLDKLLRDERLAIKESRRVI